MRRRLALLALACSTFASGVSRAEPCGRPDLIGTTPADEAADIPTNARLSAHYTLTAEYLDELVTFQRVGDKKQDVLGTFNENEGILTIEPPEDLAPDERYIVEWPRLRGFGTASRGDGKVIEFGVGNQLDEDNPQFDGLVDATWDVERERDECSDTVEDRYRIDLTLAAASDDGGRGSLTLVVFQSAGPNVGDAPDPVLVRPIPGKDEKARVLRTVDDGLDEICFAAIVRDLTGKASASGSQEVCVTTVEPPFFYGCRTALGGPSGPSEPSGRWLVFALAAWGLVRARR